jgi:hypothetical protein
MKKIRMDIKLSGHLAYRHPLLCDQLHCISFELTAEMTVLSPHMHLLSNDTNSQVCPSTRGKVRRK